MCAFSFADDAALFHQVMEKGCYAASCQTLFEGDGDVFVRDGILSGKEVGKAGFDFSLLCLNGLSERYLLYFEAAHFSQQSIVRTELYAFYTDIFSMIIAVLHLDVALQGEAEGADSWQRNGVALFEFVHHDALYGADGSLQFALWHQGGQSEAPALEVHDIYRLRTFQYGAKGFRVKLFIEFLLCLLLWQQSTFCNRKMYGHSCIVLVYSTKVVKISDSAKCLTR